MLSIDQLHIACANSNGKAMLGCYVSNGLHLVNM